MTKLEQRRANVWAIHKLSEIRIYRYYTALVYEWEDLVLQDIASNGPHGSYGESTYTSVTNKIMAMESRFPWLRDKFCGIEADSMCRCVDVP